MPRTKNKQIVPVGVLEKGRFVPGVGPSNARIAIVGEAPGADEEKEGKPFVGRAGRKLGELLSEAEINRSQCYLSNVVKYKPPGNNFKLIDTIGISLQKSVDNLFLELKSLDNLTLVIALGDQALHALTGKKGITKYRGSILPPVYGKFKVLPTIHPAALLRAENPYMDDAAGIKAKRIVTSEVVIADLIKAKKESLIREFTTPSRKLEIINDSFRLYKFLSSYKNKEPSIDIEIHKGIPTCIAIAFTPWHSVSVPLLTSIPGSKGALETNLSELISIYKVLAEFLNREDILFIGQNIKFDLDKLISPSKLLHPYTHDKVAADTSLMMGVLYPEFPKKLEFSTSIFTNEPFYKDEGKEFNPKKDPYERLLEYNAKDAAVTKEIKNNLDKELSEVISPGKQSLKDFYYGYVNKLTSFYMDMEAEGLLVDKDRRSELILEYQAELLRVHNDTVALLGAEYNARSYTKDIPHIITSILKLPPRKGYGEEELVALLGNHTEPGSREAIVIKNILTERQIHTNFNYLEANFDADGYMRSSWNIAGTETGRRSTSNLSPPLRPFKGKPHQIGLSFNTLPKHGPFARKIRSIFVAEPGYLFLERDYSQAEARIVALLADDAETLRLFDTTDIHSTTASWIFGKTIDKISEDERFIGKTARHAGNYGEQKRKLMLSANADALKFGIPIQLSEKEAQRILEVFHRKTPKIRSVFQAEVRNIVQKTRTLWNPYGRMRQFFGLLKDTEAYAQIPQSTVPDLAGHCALRMKAEHPWLRFTMDMHDAFVWKIHESRLEQALKITKEFMEVEIDFKYCSLPRGKLTIPTEAKVGSRLSELKKVKEC